MGCAPAHRDPPRVCERRFRVVCVLAVGCGPAETKRGNETMNEISFSIGHDRCAAWHFNATARLRRCGPAAVRRDGARLRGYGGHRRLDGLRARFGCRRTGRRVVRLSRVRWSSGSPRQLVWAHASAGDYHAAIAAARQLPGVDPNRILLWGISYSAGHVIASPPRIPALRQRSLRPPQWTGLRYWQSSPAMQVDASCSARPKRPAGCTAGG